MEIANIKVLISGGLAVGMMLLSIGMLIYELLIKKMEDK